MELYTSVSYELAERLTRRYSTSFSMSSRLFARSIRPHIYAIYGVVRLADEIVDSYRGEKTAELLDDFEVQIADALRFGYSANPLVQAFAETARKYGIGADLIAPFFDSMRADLSPHPLTQVEYETYIYGSAEVVGLMCLRVFVGGDERVYRELSGGARALAAAYQKVNFLRDLRADYEELGRMYFPGVGYETWSEADKSAIVNDIETDFARAKPGIDKLPANSRRAVLASYYYYTALLGRLRSADAATVARRRLRVSGVAKLLLYAKVRVGR